MNMAHTVWRWFETFAQSLRRTAQRWWEWLHFVAVAWVLVLTPSSYALVPRRVLAQRFYTRTWPVLLWFTVLCSLISMVVIRVVVVTASSYGLSQYALEMMVRVLVLELIPLSAALFVVVRSDLPADALDWPDGATTFRSSNSVKLLQHQYQDWVPTMLATGLSVLMLALMSCVITLVLAYVAVYGLSPWGVAQYTRVVGRIWAAPVALVFVLKTLLFSLAVAVLPFASIRPAASAPNTGAPMLLHLFVVLLLIEAGSLAIKYI